MEPTNEERRQILLAQHARLRRTIEAARAAARAALARGGAGGELRAAVILLERELLGHLSDEEKLLEPVLAEIDAWGALRVGLLRAEHAHQRAVLAVLAAAQPWPATTLVAGRTLGLCDELITDMEFEERELLNEKVMRDDFILLDASDA
jgi:hypothetical protein